MRKLALPFWLLFPIVLAIALTLVAVVWTDKATPEREVYLRVAIATLISAGVSAILSVLYRASVIIFRKTGKWLLTWIAIKTVRKAIISYAILVRASGIASVEGNLVVGLDAGSGSGVRFGDQFIVSNIVSKEKLGVLEVSILHAESSVCQIVDTASAEFWAALEERLRHGPSFPTGVAIERDAQDELLEQWLRNLLDAWRDQV